MTDHQAVAATLWVAHAHVPEAAVSTPYLAAISPEKRSGKTRLLEVLELLVPRPMFAANVTEAVLFRSLDAEPAPTLLLDEVDTIFGPRAKRENEALRGILNVGVRRGATAQRCEGEGSKLRVKTFNVFGPKAFAGIGNLPDTLSDRCIILAMKRRAPGKRCWKTTLRSTAPK